MNKASRKKDISKNEYYGTFASALGFIIHCGNQKNTKLEDEFNVFRGLQLLPEELSEHYKIGETLNLKGFTSTTLSRDEGINFALDNEDDLTKVPVLFDIHFKGQN